MYVHIYTLKLTCTSGHGTYAHFSRISLSTAGLDQLTPHDGSRIKSAFGSKSCVPLCLSQNVCVYVHACALCECNNLYMPATVCVSFITRQSSKHIEYTGSNCKHILYSYHPSCTSMHRCTYAAISHNIGITASSLVDAHDIVCANIVYECIQIRADQCCVIQ